MESLWEQILLFFIILTSNNLAVYSYNVPGLSLSQARIIQVDSSSTPTSPEALSQLSTFLTPESCSTFLPLGTATIIPTVPQYPYQNTFMPTIPQVHMSQPDYQVTVLPSVSPVQTASESITSPTSYSYASIPSGTYNSEQLPVKILINFPEQSTPLPMPMPLPPPAPIIMMKSGSSWKKWLPSLLVSLFANSRRCQDCGCYSSYENSDNVYVPFPIPVPTNNPIILSDDYPSDEGDENEGGEEIIED